MAKVRFVGEFLGLLLVGVGLVLSLLQVALVLLDLGDPPGHELFPFLGQRGHGGNRLQFNEVPVDFQRLLPDTGGLVPGVTVGGVHFLDARLALQSQHVVMGAVGEHRDGGEHGRDHRNADRHALVEARMGGMLGVLGLLKGLVGAGHDQFLGWENRTQGYVLR